jgi:16S rRNA (guanine966-N2)-methyltransferase
MRVVGGTLRSRPIAAPKSSAIRPTADRLRESLFNILMHGYGDPVSGARVLDLFAGTGALGIEALSRGAARCTFVERDRAALEALRDNLRRCGLGDERARVVVGDAGSVEGRWDLALLDPPYAFDGWEALLGGLDAELAVCESGAPIGVPAGWVVVREKGYGATVVAILRNEPPTEQEDPG